MLGSVGVAVTPAYAMSFDWDAEVEDGDVELNVSLLRAQGDACLAEKVSAPSLAGRITGLNEACPRRAPAFSAWKSLLCPAGGIAGRAVCPS